MFSDFRERELEQRTLSAPSPPHLRRQGHAAVTLPNPTSSDLPPVVLVLGGTYKDSMLNDVWRSDDGCRSWERVEGAPGAEVWCPRMHFGCVAAKGTIYVCGGMGEGEVREQVRQFRT